MQELDGTVPCPPENESPHTKRCNVVRQRIAELHELYPDLPYSAGTLPRIQDQVAELERLRIIVLQRKIAEMGEAIPDQPLFEGDVPGCKVDLTRRRWQLERFAAEK